MTRLPVFCLLALAAACSRPATRPAAQTAKSRPAPAPEFVLSSPAFSDNSRIPDRFTGTAENVSPTLTWSNWPPQTQSFALIVDDPDAPTGTFTHWLIYNLRAEYGGPPGLFEGMPLGETVLGNARQLKNDAGRFGYSGPLPPPGKLHHYHFTLYALDQTIEDNLTSKEHLRAAMNGHILAQTRLTGTYQR
jgi:Raf kinase inhibitor-like YbhB/YbcL family protein